MTLETLSEAQGPMNKSDFRHVIQVLPQLVWVTDEDGCGVYFNDRWYEFTGRTVQEAAEDMWSALHPDDYQVTVDRWHYSLRTREPFEVEHRIRRHTDGTFRWFLSRALPVDDPEQVTRWFGTSTDMNPQKEIEEGLRNSLDELGRSHRELEQFIHAASQELQEPLGKLVDYVKLLKEKYPATFDTTADHYVQFAFDEALRLQQLINNLLHLSRLARSTDFHPVDFNGIFSSVVSRLSDEIRDAGAEVTSDILPTVTGDQVQLELVMRHLVGNALTYRSPGTAPRVHVSARRTDGDWEFSVRDNGIGIEPHEFGRIFLIFQRLDITDEHPGAGIGLSACKKMVEQHHGRMWVESHPNEGSTFYFTIPADESEPGLEGGAVMAQD